MMSCNRKLAPADGLRMPSTVEAARFLSEYAALLFGCGATCVRMEKNVDRMAKAWNKRVSVTIMPRHIHMTVCDECSDEMHTSITTIGHSAISYDINARLSKLSWMIADKKISVGDATKLFDEIRQASQAPGWWKLIAVSCANASFCRLFGGDFAAMAVVFVATFAGFYVRLLLTGAKVDARLVFIVCAFISSVLGATDGLFSLGDTPSVAIGTSVLYLVPGIPFLNSFSDMVDGHYICSYCRLMQAMALTCCLSVGLCGGMLLMNVGMFN